MTETELCPWFQQPHPHHLKPTTKPHKYTQNSCIFKVPACNQVPDIHPGQLALCSGLYNPWNAFTGSQHSGLSGYLAPDPPLCLREMAEIRCSETLNLKIPHYAL